MSPSRRGKTLTPPKLQGTFTTDKGKTLTAEELMSSFARMSDTLNFKKYGKYADAMVERLKAASGKKMSPDDFNETLTRLTTQREAPSDVESKLHAMKLVYREGKEDYEPWKEVAAEEQVEFMRTLYQRCVDHEKEVRRQLEDKWLQPLGRPRKPNK